MKEILVSRSRLDEDEHIEIHDTKLRLKRRKAMAAARFMRRLRSKQADIAIRNEQIEELVKKILQESIQKTLPLSDAELVYEELKGDLERNHLNEVVAIDVEENKAVGFGKNIREAYHDALLHSDKKKFYFKKVGQDSIMSL